MIQEQWAEHGEVRLQYLDNQGSQDSVPLLFIPGLHGSAEDFRGVLDAIEPRRALAISLRGRGKSSVPAAGYRFEDHVRDIAALVDTTGFSSVCLVGHSVGTAYALGYTLEHPDRVSALVMAGYGARYPELSADWGFRTMRNHPNELPMIAVLGLQHDSVELDLWPTLADLSCPLLIIRGAKPTSRLPADQAADYLRWQPAARLVVFPDSGHRLWVPDMEHFTHTIEDFLQTIPG
jgi:pimeloyl-ACP methyl ester carboxylesterase